MKHFIHISVAATALALLANFSSQDSTINGGIKPNVNFYGTVTDTSDFTFKAENITLEGLYKQIPVYQIPPKTAAATYDPSVNITRLDLSEIEKITIETSQIPQRFSNRDYLLIVVHSKDAANTQNTYLIESEKKLRCDQINPAGPIEKEIKFKAVISITIHGYRQADPIPEKKPVKNNENEPSKKERLISYVQDLFGSKKAS